MYNWFISRLYTSAGQDNIGVQNLINYISATGNNANIQPTVYISPCVTGSCQSPQNQIISVYKTLNSINSSALNTGTIPMVYVDINKLTWSSNVTFNQNFLRQMVYQSTSRNSTTTIGIYTNQQDWEAVFGQGWNEFSSLPLWWNSRGDMSLNGFLPFGGWTVYSVTLRQYGINYSACGTNFLNVNFVTNFVPTYSALG